jgi:hypothetical protein
MHSVRFDAAAPGDPYTDTLYLRVLDPTTSVDEPGNLPPAEFRPRHHQSFNPLTRIFRLASEPRPDRPTMLGQQVAVIRRPSGGTKEVASISFQRHLLIA